MLAQWRATRQTKQSRFKLLCKKMRENGKLLEGSKKVCRSMDLTQILDFMINWISDLRSAVNFGLDSGLYLFWSLDCEYLVLIIDLWSARAIVLVFYPLNIYFFFRTRLNPGFVFLLEFCYSYLTVFANLTMVSTFTSLLMNISSKLMSDDFQNRPRTSEPVQEYPM